MNIATHLAAALLGLAFVASGLMYLLGFVPEQLPPPEGSPVAHFMAAFAPTGYMTFVKVCEVLGGLLLFLPRTRRAGLVVLGPILVNILAFHVFVAGGEGLFSPVTMLLCALALFLVWTERAAFGRFLLCRGE
jgi:putative oxidoreductase